MHALLTSVMVLMRQRHDSMHQDLEDILGFEEVVVSDRESKQFPELVE